VRSPVTERDLFVRRTLDIRGPCKFQVIAPAGIVIAVAAAYVIQRKLHARCGENKMPITRDATEARGIRHAADKRAILREHFLFGKLSPQHIDRLSSCIITKSFARAASIFARGDPGSSLFAIASGKVKITVATVDGHDAVFNLIGAGEIFGEIALLDGRPRTADAIAITDCELFIIERRDFLPLLREEPEIALKLIELLCARLRRTTDQAENLMFLNLSNRLAKALLQLSDGSAAGKDRKVTITQRDLANIIGMSRESTNRQLRDWEKSKWVRLERGGIIVTSVEALTAIAEGDSDMA
jgi:CRP/FNR family transcriptional regulator, cyclic AMP receptor protein